MTPALPCSSSSAPGCPWWDLKMMVGFYLVLFYTALIMLSRQVRPGRPTAHAQRAEPVFLLSDREWGGWGCLRYSRPSLHCQIRTQVTFNLWVT